MLSVGIVGLPNVGKSMLFNALLKKQLALAANYPFATIEPNIGIVPVPDDRLKKLATLVKEEEKMAEPPPIVPAMIKFVDIAGLVKGASRGEGLGNQFLSHIREVDAVAEVVRNFSDENVIRAGSTEPLSDIGIINTELALADLQTIQNAKAKMQSDRSKSKDKAVENKLAAISKLESQLDAEKPAKDAKLSGDERESVKSLQLLTDKPILYIFNSDEDKIADGLKGLNPVLGDRVRPYHPGAETEGLTLLGSSPAISKLTSGSPAIFVSAKLEAELSALSEAEQKAYLAESGIAQSSLEKVIRASFDALNLITYFTAGPKEVRAWTIKRGDKAPRAAGKIHTDFERGFIAAEVISSEELLYAGSFKKAKELGKIRLEGKEYEVKDGDVIEFRFSV